MEDNPDLKSPWHKAAVLVGKNQISAYPSDKRRADRSSAGIPVRYRLKKFFVFWRPGRSLDFSNRGIRLELPEAVSMGQRIELEISVPHLDKPVQAEGTVVWVRPSPHKSAGVICGVDFGKSRQDLDEALLKYLKAYSLPPQ